MTVRYTQVVDGEWVKPKQRGYRLMCCDCGLVHVVEFRVRHGKVDFKAVRNVRATARQRRKRQLCVKRRR